MALPGIRASTYGTVSEMPITFGGPVHPDINLFVGLQLYCERISAEGVAAEEPIERNENGCVCI